MTDAQGLAKLQRLPDVPLVVSVVALGSNRDRANWTRWESPPVEPAGETLEATLRIGRVVEGRVLDSEGQPVGHCLVSVVSPDGILGSAYSDAEGRYRLVIRPDATGPLRLGGSTDSAIGTHELVEAAGEPVDLRLDPPR